MAKQAATHAKGPHEATERFDLIALLQPDTDFSLISHTDLPAPFVQYTLDRAPEIARSILARLSSSEFSAALSELLNWAGSHGDRLSKLQGLVDVAETMGKLDCLVQCMHEKAQGTLSSYAYDAFCLLADTGDLDRVQKLVGEAKKIGLAQEMLNANGQAMRAMSVMERSSRNYIEQQVMKSQGPNGALRASVYSQHQEIAVFLIQAIRDENLLADLLINGTLPACVAIAANNSSVGLVRTLLQIGEELEGLPTLKGSSPYTVQEAVDLYAKRYASQYAPTTLVEVLLCFSGQHEGSCLILTALSRSNRDLLEVIQDVVKGNPGREQLFQKVFDGWVREENERRSWHRKMRGAGSPSLAFNSSDFAQLFAELFTLFQDSPQPAPVAKRDPQVEKDQFPAHFNRAFYEQLVPLMRAADEMEEVKGQGPEWARKLALLFENLGQVQAYLQGFISYATENPQSPILWREQVPGVRIVWPDAILHERFINTSMFGVAMGFDIPSGEFNVAGWRDLILVHPELSRYLSQAPHIENFLAQRGTAFPTDARGMREVVLNYSVACLAVDSDVEEVLQMRFAGQAATFQGPKLESAFDIGILLEVGIDPIKGAAIDNLSFLGVLGGTSLTNMMGWTGQRREVPIIIDTHGQAKISRERGDDGPIDFAGANAIWKEEETQTILRDQESADLVVLCQILRKAGAISTFSGEKISVSVNCQTLGSELQHELQKQILIDAIYFGVDPRILFGRDYKEKMGIRSGDSDSLLKAYAFILESESIDKQLLGYSPIRFPRQEISFELAVAGEYFEAALPLVLKVDQLVHSALTRVRANSGKARAVMPSDRTLEIDKNHYLDFRES